MRREEEDGGERREQILGEFIAKLDEMGDRLAMAPDYQPPTTDEAAAIKREFEAVLKPLAADR